MTTTRYRIVTVTAHLDEGDVEARMHVLLDGARQITMGDQRALPWAALDELSMLCRVNDPDDDHPLPIVVGIRAGHLVRARVEVDDQGAARALPLVVLDDDPPPEDLTPDLVLDVRLSALALVDGWVRGNREDRAAVLPETGSEYARLAVECALLASQFVQLASREGSVPVKVLLQGARQWALDEHVKATGGQQ